MNMKWRKKKNEINRFLSLLTAIPVVLKWILQTVLKKEIFLRTVLKKEIILRTVLKKELILQTVLKKESGVNSTNSLEEGDNSTNSLEEGDNSTTDTNQDLFLPATRYIEVKTLYCPVCNERQQNTTKLKQHLLAEHGKLPYYSCCKENCNFKSKTRRNIVFHAKTVHKIAMKANCPFCPKAFSVERVLDEHIKAIHDKNTSYRCIYCDCIVGRKIALTEHINRIHRDKCTFSCKYCPHITYSADVLKKHEKAVHRTKLIIPCYFCELCPYQTDIKSYLIKHKSRCPSRKKSVSVITSTSTSIENQDIVAIEISQNATTVATATTINTNTCENAAAITLMSLRSKSKSVHHDVDNSAYFCNLCSYKTCVKQYLHRHKQRSHKLMITYPPTAHYVCTVCNIGLLNKNELDMHTASHKFSSTL